MLSKLQAHGCNSASNTHTAHTLTYVTKHIVERPTIQLVNHSVLSLSIIIHSVSHSVNLPELFVRFLTVWPD